MKSRILTITVIIGVLITGCKSVSRYDYRNQAIEKMAQNEYHEAILLFEQALEASTGRTGDFQLDVLKYRGEAEYQLEDYLAAVNTYDILIQVDQERPDYLIRRCLAHLGANQLEAALEDYTNSYIVSHETPSLNAALLKLGEALTADGQTEKAIILYQQAVEDGLGDAQIYNHLGLSQIQEGGYQEALDLFEQGILLADENLLPELEYNLAATYVYEQNYEKALTLFQQYQIKYGSDAAIEKEIAFLKTR